MKNKKYIFSRVTILCMTLFLTISFASCNEFELPDSNSKVDTTPPEANFSYSATSDDYMTVKFTDISSEATIYSWDFDGEATSKEKDPTFKFTKGEGIYSVTLTVSDALGKSDKITIDVVVEKGPFQPIIKESGFEDGQLTGDTGDGRDSWRNNDLGKVIQISTDPVRSGKQAAKLTGSAGDQRIGYQLMTVEKDANYDLNFAYTMKDDKVGFLTVSVLSGPVSTHEEAIEKTIGSITVNDQSAPGTYVDETVSFNSGESEEVVIYFFNEGSVETRIDDFTIDIAKDAIVPPSASFSLEQSASSFLEYIFTNNSLNATSYLWDFGDGNTSTEESPNYTYDKADMYEVTLTANGDLGAIATFSTTIDIQAPVFAGFKYEVDPVDYRKVTFIDTSMSAESILFDFGDGFFSSKDTVVYTYSEDGVYKVKLTGTSITGATNEYTKDITISQGFIVKVLNGTFDEYTANTGDNADAWDMTPNSTVEDNSGATITSPYKPLWNNTDLNDYIDNTYCGDEQPATTSDGNDGRGTKFKNPCRRLYQRVQVEQGVEYTFSIDTRSEAMGIDTEVFILNTEITTEVGIDASKTDPAITKYFKIDDDFNADKTMFTTSTFTFTPTTDYVVIYVRSLEAVDSSNEVFIDNITIN